MSRTPCVASWSLLWRGDHKMLLRIVMMVYVLSYWISCKWYIIAQMITDLIYFVTLKLLLNFRLLMSHLIIKKWLWTPSHMPEYILLHCSEHIFFSTKCNLNLNQNNKTSVSNFIQKSSECEISKQVPNIAHLGCVPTSWKDPYALKT